MSTLKHKMANRICRLNMDKGPTDNEEIVKREAVDFFKYLLQESNLDLEKQDLFIECIPSRVSKNQNMFLTSIALADEIYKAIFFL